MQLTLHPFLLGLSLVLAPVATLSSALWFSSPGRLHLLSGLQVAHTAPAPNSPPEPACLVHTVTLPSLSFWFGVGIVVFQSPQLSHEEEEELGAYFILPPPIF